MPGLSGCSLLPGLGSLAHTQPVCAGLGLGPANPTETAVTLGHANKPEVPDLCFATHSLGGLAATSFVYTVRLAD